MVWVQQGDRVWFEEGNVSLRDQWAYYKTHKPRLLAPFRAERIEHAPLQGGGHGEPIQIDYAVFCKCGGQDFNVEATFVSGKPSSWDSPVSCRCNLCGAMELLFDLQQHGNDAEYGHAPEPAKGERRAVRFEAPDQLIVSVYYPDDGFNFDREVFARGGSIDEPRPEDCFSWARFTRLGPKRSESLMDFECA